MPHRTDVLNRIFKRIIGDETATQYYLRHTFATKCQEYVRPDIVDIWMDIAPEGLSDGFIRTFPTSLCKSKWTRLFSIFKRYLFPKTFPKRANLCNFLFIFYAKQAQKKQITEFLFDNLHKWCGWQDLKLSLDFSIPFAIRLSGTLRQNSAIFNIDKNCKITLFKKREVYCKIFFNTLFFKRFTSIYSSL